MQQTEISLTDPSTIKNLVRKAVREQPVTDLHTHCYAPSIPTTFPTLLSQ